MSNNIKQIIDSYGWKEIEAMFNQSILELKNKEVNEDLSPEDFKINTIGNREAAKKVEQLLKKIKSAGLELNNDRNISYK